MPGRSQTYSCMGLVLNKTRLAESDLILTIMAGDGSQIRAVAKGARKPTSQFASRLERFSEAEILLARGRNLDIVKEAALVDAHAPIRASLERSNCSYPMMELLDKTTRLSDGSPLLFEATHAALCAMERVDTVLTPVVCAAHLLKSSAMLGFRPSLGTCTVCGKPRTSAADSVDSAFDFSGGYVCPECRTSASAVDISTAILDWAQALMSSRYDDIEAMTVDAATAFQLLSFCRRWIDTAVDEHLKTLDALMTSDLFDGVR